MVNSCMSGKAVLCIVTAVGLAGSFIGCRNTNMSPNGEATCSTQADNIGQWVIALQHAYETGGVKEFYDTKDAMKRQWQTLRTSPDSDVAAMVLDVGETPATTKERVLCAKLRGLARSIEEHPGGSQAQWGLFRDALLSYSFGNGPVDRRSIAWRLIVFYGKMAGAKESALLGPDGT